MIHGTLSRAEELGRTIREAHIRQGDPVAAVKNATGGIEVFRGRVTDVLRRTEKGWVFGHATLAGMNEYGGQTLVLKFQNEHLVAELDAEIVVTVPDLIVVLSDETALPITTEGLRYGFRVVILGIPCDPKWRTAAGLALAGPRYFGYETDYVPVEERFSARLPEP
jgi:DUF917 family protein